MYNNNNNNTHATPCAALSRRGAAEITRYPRSAAAAGPLRYTGGVLMNRSFASTPPRNPSSGT